MALGTYNVTAMDMAGAYTIFANDGVMVTPRLISHIVDKSGKDIWTSEAETKRVLDPRVNFLVVSLMQDVLRWGTGAGAYKYGFSLPAAAKTGTSQDAWFAGFTSKLLCVVWVGLDDYKDIKMQGSEAAMPIWAEFMKKAHQHRAYRGVTQFSIPNGIVSAQIDGGSGQLATGSCPQKEVHTEYYLDGTAPTQFCPLHAGGTAVTDWQTPLPNVPATGLPPSAQMTPPADPSVELEGVQADASAQKQKKKGLLDKIKSVFHN
jgi:penicillin-binding protein 1B